jgi:hypothetical protein
MRSVSHLITIRAKVITATIMVLINITVHQFLTAQEIKIYKCPDE